MLFRISALAVLVLGSIAAFGQSYFPNINTRSPWQTCSRCAGSESVSHGVTFGVSSPSLDGKSAQFHISHGAPYSNALWWKQLGAQSGASHFVYDVYFYLKTPGVSQALEFDVNQSVGGHRYIFGTECDLGNGHVWRVYETSQSRWVSTGISCPTPRAYTWNHLTLELQRLNGQVHFVSETLNGRKSYFNRSYAPEGSGVQELNVAFQEDENGSGTAYDTFLDKVKLTYW